MRAGLRGSSSIWHIAQSVQCVHFRSTIVCLLILSTYEICPASAHVKINRCYKFKMIYHGSEESSLGRFSKVTAIFFKNVGKKTSLPCAVIKQTMKALGPEVSHICL